MPRDRHELGSTHPNREFRQRLVDGFALAQIARANLKRAGLEELARVADKIALTEAGETFAKSPEAPEDLTAVELHIGAFMAFYWRDLFVDVERTDIEGLSKVLNDCLIDRRIDLPWLYGRRIDDVYLDKIGVLQDRLDPDQTAELFSELPQGVFQFGEFVTGPWGLLRSKEGRLVRPAGIGPMLGCSDPGCNGLHSVRITAEPSPMHHAEGFIDHIAAEEAQEGPSEWPEFIRDLILKRSGDYYHDDFNLAELPLLLANALSENELRIVLAAVLAHRPSSIRDQLPKEGALADRFRNSTEAIVRDIESPELLQLVLLADDATIIDVIERAVDDGSLQIPPTESRNVVVTRVSVLTGLYRVRCELGPAGVRAIPEAWRPSVAMRLRRLIEQIYGGEDGANQLEWKLRAVPASNVSDRLDVYLAQHLPEIVVRDLVLESRGRLEAAFAHLRWGRFVIPTTPEEERSLIDRMLWKLGADIFYYPPARTILAKRLEALRRVISELPEPFGESAREAIRGPGTNLFVSLEELLDLSVCFATWALLSDHWSDARRDRFVYTPEKARQFTSAVLNSQPLTDDEILRFDSSGRNNLFALVQAFTVLVRQINELRRSDPSRYVRPPAELPHFLQSVGLEQFPYRHIYPVLDLRAESADAILVALDRVAPALDRANVLNVRNRIPHNRDPFPSRDEIQIACSAIEETTDILSAIGVLPTPYLYDGEATDRFQRTRTQLVDDQGRIFELLEPSPLRMTEMPDPEVPQLIFTAARLPASSEVLRFAYRQDSDYLERWRGFPVAASTRSTEHADNAEELRDTSGDRTTTDRY